MNIAIIPARGGSKRIRKKNIRIVAGQPLIAIVIKTLLKSRLFNQVIVSTDDEEIANVSRGAGAVVPFMRPADLSGDFVGIYDVVNHCLKFLLGSGISPGVVLCALPTAILIKSPLLESAFELLEDGKYVVPIVGYEYPVDRSLMVVEDSIYMTDEKMLLTRTQDSVEMYHDAGMFYMANTDTWLNNPSILNSGARFLKLSRLEAHDIDYPEDLIIAEMKYNLISQND